MNKEVYEFANKPRATKTNQLTSVLKTKVEQPAKSKFDLLFCWGEMSWQLLTLSVVAHCFYRCRYV